MDDCWGCYIGMDISVYKEIKSYFIVWDQIAQIYKQPSRQHKNGNCAGISQCGIHPDSKLMEEMTTGNTKQFIEGQRGKSVIFSQGNVQILSTLEERSCGHGPMTSGQIYGQTLRTRLAVRIRRSCRFSRNQGSTRDPKGM